jgi:hypothetical protein
MSYPNFIDYKNFDKYHKFYDIDIIERNMIYPFTYSIKSNIIKCDINNFIPLPNFENLILDKNGLPFIPINK